MYLFKCRGVQGLNFWWLIRFETFLWLSMSLWCVFSPACLLHRLIMSLTSLGVKIVIWCRLRRIGCGTKQTLVRAFLRSLQTPYSGFFLFFSKALPLPSFAGVEVLTQMASACGNSLDEEGVVLFERLNSEMNQKAPSTGSPQENFQLTLALSSTMLLGRNICLTSSVVKLFLLFVGWFFPLKMTKTKKCKLVWLGKLNETD